MRSIVYILLIFTFTTAVLSQPNWKYCQGADGSTISIDSIVVQPYPVSKGSTITITAKGQSIKDALQTMGRIQLYTYEGTSLVNDTVTSPANIEAGKPFLWELSYNVPTTIPDGIYNVQVSIMDEKSKDIMCVIVPWDDGYWNNKFSCVCYNDKGTDEFQNFWRNSGSCCDNLRLSIWIIFNLIFFMLVFFLWLKIKKEKKKIKDDLEDFSEVKTGEEGDDNDSSMGASVTDPLFRRN